MDRKNGSLNIIELFHTSILFFWLFGCIIFYAIICFSLSIVSRKATRWLGRIWNQHFLALSRIKVSVRGSEKIDKSKRYVFIVNHQSALDIPVLYAGMRNQLCFIAKKELFSIPIFGWGMAAMGHIWIDRSNPRKARNSILRAVSHLQKEHVSLVLFPEGTRSADGTIGDFKQGSFTLALEAGVDVVPIVLHDTRLCLPKKSSKVLPGTIHVDICDPIQIDKASITKSELCNKIRNIICETAARGPEKNS